MAATKSILSIRAAVMNCIARCQESNAPFAYLGEFLEKLAELGWSPEDVRIVALGVLPLLGELEDAGNADAAEVSLTTRTSGLAL